MKKFVVVNECYGGFSGGMEREYNSQKDFEKDLGFLMLLTKEQVEKDYDRYHPLQFAKPVLYELDLAEDEDYRIDEYDGYESLIIFKTAKLTSTYKRLCSKDIDDWKKENC